MTREPYRVVLRAPVSRLGKQLQLNDKGPSESFYVIPQQPDRNFKTFTTESLTCEMGFMATGILAEQATNTDYRIEKNQIIQTNFELADGSIDDKAREALKKFLVESTRLIEDILTTNEVINIYEDDLNYGQSSAEKMEQLKEQEEQMTIKELKCFEHESCKQKVVSRICFQPNSDLIAVVLRDNLSFDEQIEANGKSTESIIAIWNSVEFHRFSPVAILYCPLEVTTLNFKSDDPTTLIVGAINGQIFLYDLYDISSVNKNLQLVDKEPIKQKTSMLPTNLCFSDIKFQFRYSMMSNKKSEGMQYLRTKIQGSDQSEITTLKPLLMSAVLESHAASQNLTPLEVYSKKLYHFSSHRTSVRSIKFLPQGYQLEKKNPMNILTAKEGEKWACDQFVTLSEDGQLLFWDLNFNDKRDMKTGELDLNKLVWRAILSLQLFRNDQSLYNTRCFAEGLNIRTELMIGGEEGELFLVNFNSKESTNEDINKLEVIKKTWGIRSKLSTLFCEISRHIPGLYLVANDLTFSLFHDSTSTPIFTSSSIIGSRISCARFSAGRSSVIFVGREDGVIDVWDLADQTGSPSQQHLVSAVGISYIETSERKPNIIAVGDKDGSLHLLQLPKALFKPVGGEERLLDKFVQKEISRIAYYNGKYSDLDIQAQHRRQTAEHEEEFGGLKLDDLKGIGAQIAKSEDDALEDAYNKFVEENRAKLAKTA